MLSRANTRTLFCLLLLASAAVPACAQNIAAGKAKHGYCASCHGIEGRSLKPHYPVLAGQPAAYLLGQLEDFRNGRRHDPSMNPVASQLSAQDGRDLSAFFASLRPGPGRFRGDTGKAARGRAKSAEAGCAGCHPRAAHPAKNAAPRIVGQQPDYLKKQLRDFRDGRRTNDTGIMRVIAGSLSDADIDALSEYFAGTR